MAGKDGKKKYRANWLITGLTKEPLKLGDTVMLDEQEAQPFVEGGSLSPVEAKAADDSAPKQ